MNENKAHEIEIRVRYSETDAMGYLHHANYFTYFETGRIELFRSKGGSYREMEENGLFMVVARLSCQFRAPARYDDILRLRTRITRVTPAKIEHAYELFREKELLATADSVLACVNRGGSVQTIPDMFLNGC